VARCPQGMQARRLSSVKHRTQRFDDDESSACFCSGKFTFASLISFFSPFIITGSFELPSVTEDSDGVNISTSALFAVFVRDVADELCSRAAISAILLK